MKTCSTCGTKAQEDEGRLNAEGDFVCLECAEALGTEEDTNCPSCGQASEEYEEEAVCPNCGYSGDGEESQNSLAGEEKEEAEGS